MKNFFILVILILAFLSIDHKLVKEPREQLFDIIGNLFSDIAKAKKHIAAKHANEKIKNKLSLTAAKIKYIDSQTATNENLTEFHLLYCQQRKLNLHFQGDELRQICLIISQQVKKIPNR